MTLVDYNENPSLYAKLYSKLKISGTQFLAFRDIPKIIDIYVKTGLNTLDYGSGNGNSTLYLKSLGLQVEGMDINDEMIKYAKISDPTGSYRTIKTGKIPVNDSTYDLVFASWVLMEIGTKSELDLVVKEIYRVLKQNGIFIAIVCNETTYNTDWLSENTEFEENISLQSGSKVKVLFKDIDLTIYDYFWTEDDYCEVIIKGGFKLLEIHSPLGKDDDGYHWINEYNKSPCSIYVAKKAN